MKATYQTVRTHAFSLIFITLLLFLTPQVIAKPVGKEKASKVAKTFLKIEQLREDKKEEKLAKEGKKMVKSIQKHKIENTTRYHFFFS